MDFKVRIKQINQPVLHHPNADRLSIVKIGGYEAISNKVEGEHRYKEGDWIVYIPEASLLPEWLLKRLDMWDHDANKGALNGPEGNRVKAIRLRGIFSQGILFPVEVEDDEFVLETETSVYRTSVANDVDVAEVLGIVKYEPVIPTGMAGEVCNVFGHTMKYDFDNWQSVPDIFENGEEVVALEKLHGSFLTTCYDPDLHHPEIFCDGHLFVGSKGQSAQGRVFKDNEANANNLYVKALKKLLADGFGEKIKNLSERHNAPVHVFAECYGPGVQDLHYGLKQPELACFDIAINREFLGYDDFLSVAKELGLPIVPLLYEGPFDADVLKTFRDGKTSLGEANIREGIVIKTRKPARHTYHGRKIAKMVSPNYLLRKGGTEFN